MIEQNLCVTIASLSIAVASFSFIPVVDKIGAQTPLVSQNPTPNPNNSISAMENVARAVLADAAKRTGKPVSELTVSEIKQQDWSDGCLGLLEKDSVCTQAIVTGWRVVVGGDRQNWVYRTNMSGSVIKWDAAASQGAAEVSTNPEEEDNPAILPNPKPSKLPLRIVSVSPSPTNRRKPTIAVSPSPIPVPKVKPIPVPRVKPSPLVVLPSPKPSIFSSPSPKPVATRQVRSSAKLKFRDVPQEYWARDFIAELAQRDIIKGSDNRFRPGDPVTNAEFAAMLSLAFPRPNVREAIDFADITPQEWAHSYLLEAYQRGFLDVGRGNKVYPERLVSRLNVLAALTKGLKYTSDDPAEDVLKMYRDASAIAPEYREAVAAATEKGLVVNYPNTKMLKPNRRATRAEVAALIYQAMVSTGQAAKLDSPYIVLEPQK